MSLPAERPPYVKVLPKAATDSYGYAEHRPPQDLTPGTLTKIRNKIRKILTGGAPPVPCCALVGR